MNLTAFTLAPLLLVPLVPLAALQAAEGAAEPQKIVTVFRVKDFGGFPDDGLCDIKAINTAIAAAAAKTPAVIEFEAGTYNLHEPDQAPDALIEISKISNLTLLGKTAPDGTPATIIERNVVKFGEHLDAAVQFKISDSSDITIRNIVGDQHRQRTECADQRESIRGLPQRNIHG